VSSEFLQEPVFENVADRSRIHHAEEKETPPTETERRFSRTNLKVNTDHLEKESILADGAVNVFVNH
jgi:hypothetical protein